MSIQERIRKIKGFLGGDVYVVLVIVFVGTASFGLGRLSLVEEQNTPVQIQYPDSSTAQASVSSVVEKQTESAAIPVDGQLVASRNGTKYHFPWCSGAQRIKEENKVWFSSKAEAERAGYTPAANCKGL